MFTVNLSDAVGATIADGTGVATITDDENPPTKFYIVNDGSPDRTYEYGVSGAAIESYAINSGNTAPRGAASTVAGDKTWVVDANRKVYVYNASGGLLGSWTPGGLNASAQLEGIATDGIDIWLVDAKIDKVYKYTAAASRLSGSQNAVSSFNLNSANKNPTDIVTDGTSIWVVDDCHHRQGLQVHALRFARRKLDDHVRRGQSDGHYDRPGQRQRHLDRR